MKFFSKQRAVTFLGLLQEDGIRAWGFAWRVCLLPFVYLALLVAGSWDGLRRGGKACGEATDMVFRRLI